MPAQSGIGTHGVGVGSHGTKNSASHSISAHGMGNGVHDHYESSKKSAPAAPGEERPRSKSAPQGRLGRTD